MRIKRATVVTIIILTLSMGLARARAQPDSLYPVVVTLDTGETVFIATHTSNLASGNWIELSGGTEIRLPSLTLAYEGLDNATYEGDVSTVTIESSFAAGEAIYPLDTHHVYSAGQSITATFWGASPKMGPVDFRLIRISSISEARDILMDAFQGDLTTLKTELSEAIWTEPLVWLDGVGDATVTIDPDPEAGVYILAVVKQNDDDIWINAATIIAVVDQTLDVTCPSSVQRGTSLKINTGLSGTYLHGAILIQETAYSAEVKLVTEGTVLTTELRLNEVEIADGAFVTEPLSLENAVVLLNQLKTAFGSNQMAYGVNLISGSMYLSTSSLATGDYVLLVGVYNFVDSRIVGVYQKTVTVKKYTPPSPVPPVNKEPHAKAGPNQKAWVDHIVYFNGSKSKDPDGTIISHIWDFGDDTPIASGEEVEHAYSEPGDYEVTLTVKDNRMAEDSDTCKVKVFEPPTGVDVEFSQVIPGLCKRHFVDASNVTGTTILMNTTDQVTVTILKFDDNPHPGDPIPATAIQLYVDVMVSDSDAVEWPIYVEMHYTDQDIEGLEESSLCIYYWFNGTWQRCSDTGVDTMKNIVWAYMTAEEASGSPILIAGMHAIPTPPLPPFLSDLTVTPSTLEQGDDVTISVDIMNPNDIAISYRFEMQIGELNLLVDVELEAYESKTVSRTLTMYTAGEYTVTVYGMTESFTVEAPEIPLKPAEFVLSDLTITPEEIELGKGIDVWSFRITVNVKNVGEQEGTHTVDLKVDGDVIQDGTVILWGGEETMIVFDVTRGMGSYTVEVEGLTDSFTVTAYPKPAEFVVSELGTSPEASSERPVEEGEDVTFTVKVTNIGETEGSYTVEFKVDGETIETETVTLAGGESTTVSFEGAWSAGTYRVNVEDLTKTFRVSKKPVQPLWMQPGYAAGILILIASAAAVIYFAWKAKLFTTVPSDPT